MSESLLEGTRRAQEQGVEVQRGLGLEALTVEKLDRLAVANNVEDYPQTGTKRKKIDALEAAEVAVTPAN